MIYSVFYCHNSPLGQQLSFKCKHHGVVPVHGPWSRISKTSQLKLKREVSQTGKRFKIAIMFSGRQQHSREERNGFVKQMSSSKCSFTCICGIFLPLNPSMTAVYTRSAFYPSLHFTLTLQSAFYTQSAFYPWSTVCSPQSTVLLLHWPFGTHPPKKGSGSFLIGMFSKFFNEHPSPRDTTWSKVQQN